MVMACCSCHSPGHRVRSGYSFSQQVEEAAPNSTFRNGRISSHGDSKDVPDNTYVPISELSSLNKDQGFRAAGQTKSDGTSFKASATLPETQKSKLTFVAEKPLLEESSVREHNIVRDQLVSSGTEGQLRSSCSSFVGDMRINSFVGKPRSPLDDWLSGITSSIPLATGPKEGFQSNGSASESLHVFVESELQDPLISERGKQAEQLGGLVRKKRTSVIELAKVMTYKEDAAAVQGEQEMKVVQQPLDLRDTSAIGDKLSRQLIRQYRRQGDSATKFASFLTDARASAVWAGTKAMSIAPRPPDLQGSTHPGGNNRAQQVGKVTTGSSDSATKLVTVMTGEGEDIVTDSDDDFEVITEPSRDVVTTVLHFDRELGKRRKIMRSESGGSLKQVVIADDATAKVKKTNVPQSSIGTEKIKADSNLMKKHIPILKGGIQRTVPVLKTINTRPLSSHLSVPPAVTAPLGTVGRSYSSSKTWRREATPVDGQRLLNTPQKPAVVAQPSTYVRKKFSIIRYPAPQVPLQSHVGAPTALSTFPQGSVTQSRNKKYTLSASKPMVHPQVSATIAKTAVSAAAASPTAASPAASSTASSGAGPAASAAVKTLNTKMSKPGATPPEKLIYSSERRSHSVGGGTLVTQSQAIVSDLAPVSNISPSKPSQFEGSSDLTTLACSPASKSPGRATDEEVGYVVSGTRLYRKRKSDQVHVRPPPTAASPNLRSGLEKCDVPLGYIKRKTNQLVRCDHPEASVNDALQNVVEGGDQVKFMNRQKRYYSQLKTKTKLGRVLSQKKGRIGLARVWTLSNEGKNTTTALGTSRDWRYPLFPWKRSDIVAPRLRRAKSLHEGKMGALFFHISNQLQKYRLAHPVYTRSADGFSLHRSGVVSKSGANLKWTKSLGTQSILASEAATKVVAEAEKMKRDKKEAVVSAVAKAKDDRRAELRSGSVGPSSVSSLKPFGIGGAVYVRKGFGNQLVRNSRTVARAVASEKFRWSLRNARLRRAKKQSFCVYYTRFGVCKRGDGKCLYVHDPEKVAVCTKFLRGSCSDPACRLTHKVIPERMSDCSYFLEGLCTNESCPYRHVNVNKDAPICEAFLQGYCADGDMCNKKHTYVCPEYTLAGSCSSSNCKLRHPKKPKQTTSASKDSVASEKEAHRGSKRELQKGRYFTLSAPAEGDHQGQLLSTANFVGDKIAESGDDLIDFISIDEYDSESSKEYQDTGTL